MYFVDVMRTSWIAQAGLFSDGTELEGQAHMRVEPTVATGGPFWSMGPG